MASESVELPGSRHPAPAAMRAIGRAASDDTVTVSVYLRPKEGGAAATRATIARRRAAEHADDLAAVGDFAKAAGLEVVESDPARRLVQLRGTTQAIERAFGTELHTYRAEDGATYRGRAGALTVPADLAPRISAVLGLTTAPVARPRIVPHRGSTPPKGFLPTEVATLYGFAEPAAEGECVAIIELGGGYTAADNKAAFKAMALPVPKIVAVSVDGAKNDPGDTSGANGEVALDIQVVGGFAPGARIAVYFAPNTSQGFADAISQAVHDRSNKPSAISISWGSAEDSWSDQAIAAMRQAFDDAAALGVSVFAASGDSLATDGADDKQAHVDYPASDPAVVGCGGTRITAAQDRISREVVWNSHGGGTGGGVSARFAKPAYQAKVKVPTPAADGGGRGVPDVAGNADPDSGFSIVVGGETEIIGGTSAVAPLWAGIAAVLNAARADPLGAPHALFYGHRTAFRDIRSGNNKVGDVGFTAATGWDACTGLGSPVGAKLRKL